MTQEHQMLRLRVQDLEDISVLSSVTQDSLVALCDVSYLADDKVFIAILNRFCWEDIVEDDSRGPFNRTHTALRFDNVKNVQMRNIESNNKDAIHSLLTIAYDEASKTVALHFAGNGAIRLEMTGLNCLAEDMGDSWPSSNKPDHVLDS